MKPICMLLLATGLLIGCATTTTDEASTWFRIPVGSKLVLATPIEVPAWQNKVYFQNGVAMNWKKVNIYLPHCALAVAEKTKTSQSISPDSFQVNSFRSEHFFKQVRRNELPSLVPAAFSAQMTTTAGWDRDGGNDYEVTAMVIGLESARQPSVKTMTCADWGLPQDTMHITVEKVRQALGGIWRLELHADD